MKRREFITLLGGAVTTRDMAAGQRPFDRVSGSNQPNAVPIRMIHDRWIDKYRDREVSALLALKAELEDKDR